MSDAIATEAAQRDVVLVDLEGDGAADAGDRPLQSLILEREDLAAFGAYEVMVMVVRADRLEPGKPLTQIQAGNQPQRLEFLENPVHARARHRTCLRRGEGGFDLEGRQRTALFIKQLDDRCAGTAAPIPRVGEHLDRILSPSDLRSRGHRA